MLSRRSFLERNHELCCVSVVYARWESPDAQATSRVEKIKRCDSVELPSSTERRTSTKWDDPNKTSWISPVSLGGKQEAGRLWVLAHGSWVHLALLKLASCWLLIDSWTMSFWWVELGRMLLSGLRWDGKRCCVDRVTGIKRPESGLWWFQSEVNVQVNTRCLWPACEVNDWPHGVNGSGNRNSVKDICVLSEILLIPYTGFLNRSDDGQEY